MSVLLSCILKFLVIGVHTGLITVHMVARNALCRPVGGQDGGKNSRSARYRVGTGTRGGGGCGASITTASMLSAAWVCRDGYGEVYGLSMWPVDIGG